MEAITAAPAWDATGLGRGCPGPGFRACALENRSDMGEHQADPVLLCVGVGALSETGAGPGQSEFLLGPAGPRCCETCSPMETEQPQGEHRAGV